uniref:Uncharacterized protein n=1 Tax=Rhizophora mucronata TaxID=61149 RepID=A0A2P2PN81_RHIMU
MSSKTISFIKDWHRTAPKHSSFLLLH